MTDREALVERALVAFLKEFHRKAGTTSWTRGWIRDSLEAALAVVEAEQGTSKSIAEAWTEAWADISWRVPAVANRDYAEFFMRGWKSRDALIASARVEQGMPTVPAFWSGSAWQAHYEGESPHGKWIRDGINGFGTVFDE